MLTSKLVIVLAASSLVSVVVAEKDCKQSNGFKYSVCGDGLTDAQQTCCKADQKCVQVTPFSGNDMVACSESRQLTNTKAVKIIIIPTFFIISQISFIVYMVLRCKVKESLVTKLCVAMLAICWPWFFSMYWMIGVYTSFLATMVAVVAGPSIDCPKIPLPWWACRLLWAVVLFQIIAYFGPNEAFHVPLYEESNISGNAKLIERIYNPANCNSHFNSYFELLTIEKQEKEADPDATHFGYCSKAWLATVQSFGVVQSILWIGILLASARTLLSVGSKTLEDHASKVAVASKVDMASVIPQSYSEA